MKYFDFLKRSLQILVFNEKEMLYVADSREATNYGLMSLILIGLIGFFLDFSTRFSSLMTFWDAMSPIAFLQLFLSILIFLLVFVMELLLGLYVLHFFACVFDGKAAYIQYMRVMSSSVLFLLIPLWVMKRSVLFLVIPLRFLSLLLKGAYPCSLLFILWFSVSNTLVLKRLYVMPYKYAIPIGFSPCIYFLFF